MEKIKKFIKENSLSFSGSGSDLNSSCVIIAGYADYLGGTTTEDIIDAIAVEGAVSAHVALEIRRVFAFARTYNYGNWWKEKEAKSMYKF